jgi:hypothetical protein
MARLRFTGRYPSSGRRNLSVNRCLRENIKTGLKSPDKAKYQHRGWAKSEYRSGPDRSIKLTFGPEAGKVIGCRGEQRSASRENTDRNQGRIGDRLQRRMGDRNRGESALRARWRSSHLLAGLTIAVDHRGWSDAYAARRVSQRFASDRDRGKPDVFSCHSDHSRSE